MRKKLVLGMIFVFLLCFVCVTGTQSIHAENKKAFSGEVTLVKEEENSYAFQVKVENQGEDFDGIVRLNFGGSTSESVCAYDMQLALPSGGEKQYTLTIPAFNLQNVRGSGYLTFIDKDDKVLQTFSFQNVFQGKTIGISIGVLSDHFDSLSYMDLGGESYYIGNSEKPISLVEMNPENIEEQLDGIYFLIIDQFDMSTLDKKSVAEIEAWVDKGGWLIIGTGEYAEKTLGSFDSGFLDVTLGEVSKPGEENAASLGMTNLGRYYYYSESGIDFGNTPIAELNDKKLQAYETDTFPGMIFTKGRGSVTVLTFSLGEDEMRKANTEACRAIYDETSSYSNSYGMAINNGLDEWAYLGKNAMGVIDHINTTVDFTGMKVIIIVYVILVGPVLYLILRKFKKSEYYWGGVPVLALVFIGMVFLYGQSMKVNDTRVYSVSVQCADGKEKQKVETYYNAYHSGVRPWSFHLEDGYQYGGAGLEYYPVSVASAGDYYYRIQYGDGIELGMNPQSNFENGYLCAVGEKKGCGEIQTKDLQITNQTQSGSITNQTEYDFPYVFLLSDDHFMAVKDVKANETVDLAQAKKDKRIVYDQTTQYIDDVYYSMVENYRNAKDTEDQDLYAALFIGMCTARQECEWGRGQIVVCGVTADSGKTVADKCFETSYGCLYTIAQQEVSDASY